VKSALLRFYYGSADENYICTNPLLGGSRRAPYSIAGAFFGIKQFLHYSVISANVVPILLILFR